MLLLTQTALLKSLSTGQIVRWPSKDDLCLEHAAVDRPPSNLFEKYLTPSAPVPW